MSDFTVVLEKHGLNSEEKGVCHGLAVLSVIAFLLGEKEFRKFKERCLFINFTNSDFFDPDKLKSALALVANIEKVGSMAKEGASVIFNAKKYIELEVEAFLQCIDLFNFPERHEDLFKKKMTFFSESSIASIAQSQMMEAEGGLKSAGLFTDIYSYSGLNDFLIKLTKSDSKNRISGVFTGKYHSVMFGFDPKEKIWVLHSHGQIFEFEDNEKERSEFIETIFDVFETSTTENIALGSKFFSTGKNNEVATQLVDSWRPLINFPLTWKKLKVTWEELKVTWEKLKVSGGELKKVEEKLKTTEGKLKTIEKSAADWLFVVSTIEDKKSIEEFLNQKEKNHNEIARSLLKETVNVVHDYGYTALSCTLNSEIVKMLLERGAEVNVTREGGNTPLLMAVQENCTEIVELLLEKDADPNAKREDGFSSLLIAVQENYTEIVELLLEKDADPNAKREDGLSSLLIATLDGHTKIVEKLLEKGADVNDALHKNGVTPLLIAVQENYTEIVEILLKKGAEVNVVLDDGWNALLLAVCNGHVKIVEMLLEKGADVTMTLKNGFTPLLLAVQNGHVEIVKMLLERGAEVNGTLYSGWSSLFMAVQTGDTTIVKLLLEKGANIDARLSNGDTLLSVIHGSGHTEIIKLINNEIKTREKRLSKKRKISGPSLFEPSKKKQKIIENQCKFPLSSF